ncbi:hypothetical protein JXB01_00965 [Candidatus Micrarchaeota archaeon]|nr:hypothetical protein [Candidatus Micrarchaeota archaeon]
METKQLAVIFIFVLVILTCLLYENNRINTELKQTILELNQKVDELNLANQQITQLNTELRKKNTELTNTQTLLLQTIEQLNSTETTLSQTEEELNSTKEQLDETKTMLDETKDDFTSLKNEINEMQESIDSSIQWFKDNSELPSSSILLFTREVRDGCIEGETLNLGCVPHVMNLKLDFTYKTEYPDKLYSIKEMMENEGGDCEDYSLFLKAFLNTMKERYETLKLEAWKSGPGEYMVYSDDDGKYWYYEGRPFNLGDLNALNSYVICYTTVYTEELFEGHCIVAVSESEITSTEDITVLNNAETFEPQNGRYAGEIGDDFLICEEGEEFCQNDLNKISFVISDNDLYYFENGQWNSYERYKKSLSYMADNIEKIINEKFT